MQAALWCALLGDALGVPYEFFRASELPPLADLEFTPPAGFDQSHRGTPAGTWSDDGALMLALLDSLCSRAPFDLQDFSARMLRWYQDGEYTPDGRVFDIGLQTRAALERIAAGAHPLHASENSESMNGNGALMRVLPVAFMPLRDADLVWVARLQGVPTHAHLRSQLCCAFYTLLVVELVHGSGKADALARAAKKLRALTPMEEQPELERVLHRPATMNGSGYVLDSLWSAWHSFEQGMDVKSTLRAAVAMGNDTDTTACLAGGLAGAYWGQDAIPLDWIAQLKGRQLVHRLLMRV